MPPPPSRPTRRTHADAPGSSHKDHQHDTEVCEVFNPAVTKETVKPVETVQETIAVDREVHQDHHQTRIQPVEDHVRHDDKHEHNVLPVEYRDQRHGKDAEIQRKLDTEVSPVLHAPQPAPLIVFSQARQFLDSSTTLETSHKKLSSSTMSGEHVHHHVHEKVQPVIEREVVQPTIIHTTVPIHERIEHEPTFHPATIQPKMTMEEFRNAGGTLTGRAEACDLFDGEPQIKENGGAGETHPNAYSRPTTGGLTGGAFRRGGTPLKTGGEEKLQDGASLREGSGIISPPIKAA